MQQSRCAAFFLTGNFPRFFVLMLQGLLQQQGIYCQCLIPPSGDLSMGRYNCSTPVTGAVSLLIERGGADWALPHGRFQAQLKEAGILVLTA